MARSYIVKKGDTLRKISKEAYGSVTLHAKLAQYNGILRPQLIWVGQILEIPARRDLEGSTLKFPEGPAGLRPPAGLEQILATFGNIYEFIREDGTLDPRWETQHLVRTLLPFPISLSWDPSKQVRKLYCNTKLSRVFPQVFEEIERGGLRGSIRSFGGCFNYRSKRTSGKLSTHSWGIAIDLNPETNVQGKTGDMDAEVVEVFRRFGFKWGGDWSGRSKDPMHFQFCVGY